MTPRPSIGEAPRHHWPQHSLSWNLLFYQMFSFLKWPVGGIACAKVTYLDVVSPPHQTIPEKTATGNEILSQENSMKKRNKWISAISIYYLVARSLWTKFRLSRYFIPEATWKTYCQWEMWKWLLTLPAPPYRPGWGRRGSWWQGGGKACPRAGGKPRRRWGRRARGTPSPQSEGRVQRCRGQALGLYGDPENVILVILTNWVAMIDYQW